MPCGPTLIDPDRSYRPFLLLIAAILIVIAAALRLLVF